MAIITQRIRLEGGDDVKKALEELGAAGEKSFQQIQDAAEKTKIDPATQKSFEDLVGAASELAKQSAAIAEATSKSSPEIEQIGKAAIAAAEGLAKIGEVAELLVGKLSQIAEAVSAAQSNIDQVAKSAPPAAEQFTALGNAGEKSADGMAKAGDAAEQSSGQVAQSGAAAQDAVRFWSLFALEVVKTGAAIGQTVAALEEATASAGKAVAQIGLAIAALGLFVLELGKTAAAALTPHITEQSDALVKAALEYDKTRAEIAKLNAETAKLSAGFDNSTGSIAKVAEGIANVADTAAKAADGIAKLADAGGGAASAFVQTGLGGAKLYETLVNLSKATGQSINELQVGQQAFEHIGVAAEAFGAVVINLQKQLAGLDAGSALAASARTVEAATDKVDAASKRLLETQKKVLEAQIRLDEAGGSRAPYDARQQLADIDRQLLALTNDRATAENTLRDAQNASADAAKAVSDAQLAKAKAIATSLETVLQQVKAIIAGQQDIKFDEATSAATKINAVQIALKKVSEQAGATAVDVVQALVTIIAKATDIKDAFAIGKQFGIDEAAVNSIRQYGSEASNVADTLGRIPNLFQKIREGGVAIGPEAAANFDKVKQSSEALEDSWVRLGKAWAAIFPPTQRLEEFKQKQIELAKAEADAIDRQNRLKKAWIDLGAGILEVGFKIVTTMGRPEFWKAIIPQPVANAFDWIATTFFAAIGRVQERTQATTGFIRAWLTTPIVNAWQWIVDTFGLAKQQVETAAQPGFIERWVTTPVANAWQWIVDTFNSAVSFINAGIAAAKQLITDWITTPVANAWQWIVDTFNSTVASLQGALADGVAAITAFVTTPVAAAWKWIKDAWNANVPKFAQIGGEAAGGEVGAHAGGGLLGGRGTGTSDSNLAWVSRGEYITPARTVSQPGVLAFLEALRRSGGNLRDVLDGMGRFALGGMVQAPLAIPAFAGGGMHAVTIQFPGLPEITGLRASSAVVDELRKAAAMAQVRSGGRKPSRYS